MKTIVFAIGAAVLLAATVANADYVNGYYRSDGTYVAPHYRSSPDSNFNNNWSTQGNYNPFTGEEGTKTQSGSSSICARYPNTYGCSN